MSSHASDLPDIRRPDKCASDCLDLRAGSPPTIAATTLGPDADLMELMENGLLAVLCLCSALNAQDLGRLACTSKRFGLPATAPTAGAVTADKLGGRSTGEFLECGEVVQITGLKGSPEHNGRIGVVTIGCEGCATSR